MNKSKTSVKIADKTYVISGSDSEIHIKRVAEILDRKIYETSVMANIPKADAAILVAVNLMDELTKAKDEITFLQRRLNEATAKGNGTKE